MKLVETKKIVLFLCVIVLGAAGCDLIVPKPAKKALPAKAFSTAPKAVKAESVKEEALPAGVLAKVGDWTLTETDFNKRIEAVKKVIADFDPKNMEAKGMVLQELIRQQLLVQEAKAQKLDQTKDVEEAVKDFENTLLVQELVGRLTQDIKVTDAEAKAYYDANPNDFVKPVEKKLNEIMVPTETEAKDALVKVLQGADFAQTAKEISKSKSAANGGDLGFLDRAPFEQMQKAVDNLNKGSVSSVFQGPDGFYIVKVEDVRGGDKVTLESVKDDLMKGLTVQKQQQAVMDKLDDIAKRVNVKVNSDLLKKTGE